MNAPWQNRIRYREDLDFPALLSALKRAQSVTRNLLDGQRQNDRDEIAQLHDDLSDREAEIEHLIELEAERMGRTAA